MTRTLVIFCACILSLIFTPIAVASPPVTKAMAKHTTRQTIRAVYPQYHGRIVRVRCKHNPGNAFPNGSEDVDWVCHAWGKQPHPGYVTPEAQVIIGDHTGHVYGVSGWGWVS